MIHFLDAQTDKIIGYLDGGDEKYYFGDEIEEVVKGEKKLTFTLPATLPEGVGIENRQRIIVPGERKGFQEFICYNAVTTKKGKTIVAVGSELEINKSKVLQPGKYDGYTLRQALMLATDGIDWQDGDVIGGKIKDFLIDKPMGGFDFLKMVASLYDVEILYRIESDGRYITGRYVDAVERSGERSGKEFVNAKDLIDVKKEVFTERFITALWVVPPNAADGNPKPPLLITDKDAYQRWNRKGQHLYGIHVIDSTDEEMTTQKIKALGENELAKRIASVVEYTIEAVDLAPAFPHEAVYLGDTVRVVDEDFTPPLYAEARIISCKRNIPREDLERPQRKTFTIGEVVEYKKADIDKTVAEMQANFLSLIRNVERQALEAAATAEGIVGSEQLQQLLDTKADVDMVGHLVTSDQLNQFDNQMNDRITDAIKNIDMSDYITGETIDERIETVKNQIQDANAYNLVKNSVGYAGRSYWNLINENDNVFSVMNSALERLQFGAGFHFPRMGGTLDRGIEQIINVEAGVEMTFSWFIEKTQPGAFKIELIEETIPILTVPDFTESTYAFRSSFVSYTPKTNQVAIRFTAAPATEATITGIMAAPGNLPKKWTLARGELYNAYVRVDDRGLSIYRLDAEGGVEGYSVVSPEEFAIYYDENKNGDMEKVFWFNRDKTVTKRLEVLQEISMKTVKIIYIDSPSSRGIAYVRRVLEED